jgi:hypothetical protein
MRRMMLSPPPLFFFCCSLHEAFDCPSEAAEGDSMVLKKGLPEPFAVPVYRTIRKANAVGFFFLMVL